MSFSYLCFTPYFFAVGQQHVKVKSSNLGKDIRVDKDVELVREHFNLDHIDYEHMSPIIIPDGYTRDYVDGKISFESQANDLENGQHWKRKSICKTAIEKK